MRRRVVGAVVLAVGVGVGAAGCGADSPKPGPVVESSTSPQEERAQAVQAAQTWIAALNSSSRALDPTAVRQASAPNCDPCSSIADYIAQISSDGGFIRGGEWTNPKLAAKQTKAGAFIVRASVMVTPQRVREARGARIMRFDGGPNTPKQFTVAKSGSRWLVSDLEQEDTL